jgi:hypothetical protein
MNTKQIIIISIVALAAVGIGLGAFYYYTQMPQPVDETALRVYADPMTENLLQAINTVDYSSFSEDFDSTMKSGITEQSFISMCSTFQSKVGNYTSKTFVRGESLQGYIIAYYSAAFTDEPAGVSVKVVFSSVNGSMKITGLWFDSPKLRQS